MLVARVQAMHQGKRGARTPRERDRLTAAGAKQWFPGHFAAECFYRMRTHAYRWAGIRIRRP